MNVTLARPDDSVQPTALTEPISASVGTAVADEKRAYHLVIDPPGKWPGFGMSELWAYRGMLFFLVWRSIKVKYAQTVLGVGYAILQPVLTMLVFTVIFGKFARIPSDGVAYPIFSFAALVPWTYFASAFTGASNSLVGNTGMFTKVYFPRLILPYVPVFAGLIDFSIAFTILLAMVLYFGMVPLASAILVLPLLIVVMMMTAAGIGCWLAAINIQYRDVKVMTSFFTQFWMYATPIVYPLSIVPGEYRTLYMLNPMVGVIEGFRSVLLGTNPVPWSAIGISVAVASTLLISGAIYFRRTEAIFTDVA